MSNLIIVVGPPAVGKMTVGQALSDLTGYPLLHNHISIEVALRFFDFGTAGFSKISGTIRNTIFDAVAESDVTGLIFTYVWAFDADNDREAVERMVERWRGKTSGDVFFLELTASDEQKRERNRHPDRLAEKPSKRNVTESEARRHAHEKTHRFTSDGAFPLQYPHLLIDNSNLSPSEVAERFLAKFNLG